MGTFYRNKLEGAIEDYTNGALDGYEASDVAGLLTDRLLKGRERLDEALETVKALCEPVLKPYGTQEYLHYFCAEDTADKEALAQNEQKRLALYKDVAGLMRAYANLANEMEEAGYSADQIKAIKQDVFHYDKVRDEVKLASGDYLDMKRYEPAMWRLLDTYIRASESEVISGFEELGLVDLIVKKGLGALEDLPEGIKADEAAMAETIENNIRKVIVDEKAVNPAHFGEMSDLLNALIKLRRSNAIEYKEYQLAMRVKAPGGAGGVTYPNSIDTAAKKSLYDNMGQDEAFVLRIDTAVRHTKKDDWMGHRMKEKEVKNAIYEEVGDRSIDVDEVMDLIKNQYEYK